MPQILPSDTTVSSNPQNVPAESPQSLGISNVPPVPVASNPSAGSPALDIQVVNLARAIKENEGGMDVSKKGASGEMGEYQWMPATWDEQSKAAGVNVPLDQANNAQQNEVAYKTISRWKQDGYTPAQIASLWNSNDANAYMGSFANGDPSIGTNSSGVSYDVPSYVQKVVQSYQKFKQQSGDAAPAVPSDNASADTASSAKVSDTAGALAGGVLATGLGLALPWLLGPEAGVPADIAEASAIPGFIATAGGLVRTGAGAMSKGGFIGNALKFLGLGEAANLSEAGIRAASSLISGNKEASSPPASGENQKQSPPDISSFISPAGSSHNASKESEALAAATLQALERTPTGRTMAQDPLFKQATGTMGVYGLGPDISEEGYMDYSSADKKASGLISQLATAGGRMMENSGEIAPLVEAQNNAYGNIDKNRALNEEERNEAKSHIDKYVSTYNSKYGDGNGNMNLGHMDTFRSEMGSGFDKMDTNGKRAAKRALYHGLRDTIVSHTKHKELYNAYMKEEQKLINARKVMRKLNGKKSPQQDKNNLANYLKNWIGRSAAITIGDKIGGPLGAVIGNLTASWISRSIYKNHGKTIFETPAVHMGMKILQKNSPEFYRIIIDELKKNGVIVPKDHLPENIKKKGLIELKSTKGKTLSQLSRRTRLKSKSKK